MRKRFLLIINFIAVFILLTVLTAVNTYAACTPVSATLCVNGDDNTSVWLNGNYVGAFNYVNWDSTSEPVCMSVPVAWINSTGANSIALSVTDTGGGQIWGAFALDVECAGGLHSYVSSNEGGIALSATLDYNIPPADDGGGNSWYETNYDDSAWGSAVMVTDKTWAKLLYNPADGTVVDPYSYDAIGNSGANEYDMYTGQNMLYMRKTFTLNPVSPLPSPTITITKFSDTTAMITGGPVSITLTVCSMGGYINGSVMITDTWTSDAACGWTMGNPFYYDDLNNGQLFRDDDNDRFTLYFPLGFEANECKTFVYEMNPCWFDTTVYDYGNGYWNDTWCSSMTNYSSVTFSGGTASDQETFSLYCPSKTSTAVASPTRTVTPTNTPVITMTTTITASPTRSITNTVTGTATVTASPTVTITRTATPTATPTGSPTLTPQSTFTSTLTVTSSVTLTVSPSSSATLTATRTVTATASPSSSSTVTPTRTITMSETVIIVSATITLTWTASPTSTPSATSTVTVTLTDTATVTLTATNTYTDTATDSPTQTFTYTDTVTATFTHTFTNTATDTATQTYTASDTVTGTPPPTFTYTDTPTDTNTATYTNTYTHTNTLTATDTFTNTHTETYTVTPSDTATDTATATFTDTATHTFTFTDTATYTATFTHTNTFTQTFTFTNTYTPTQTPTHPQLPVTLDVVLKAKGDNPAPGAVITYTLRIANNDYAPVSGIMVYDILPDVLVFRSYTQTAASLQVNGNNLTWDFGPDFTLNPGESYTLEFTVEMLRQGQDGDLVINTADVEYNDPFYTEISGTKHTVSSNMSFYPEGIPAVYPNPFDRTKAKGGMLKFLNLAPYTSVRIYTLSGEGVFSGSTNSAPFFFWDGRNNYGKPISPGIYYWVTNNMTSGQINKGKLLVVK
ncbi:MAG: DUF11 domain-containing protein [Candidatus Goldbacteria bacterium]|nr:DUF11 domain-containing protein [Candidatus Goldiibacteriota bacterium]